MRLPEEGQADMTRPLVPECLSHGWADGQKPPSPAPHPGLELSGQEQDSTPMGSRVGVTMEPPCHVLLLRHTPSFLRRLSEPTGVLGHLGPGLAGVDTHGPAVGRVGSHLLPTSPFTDEETEAQ